MDVSQIADVIRRASRALFNQLQYSNGFTSTGDSELAEASLVIHVAAEFIANKHVVWPESPFRSQKSGRTKHLDLLIHLNPQDHESPDILILEAKAISPGHEVPKLDEIIHDHARILDWKLLDPSGQPIFFAVDPPRRVRGVLVVLLTEEVDKQLQPPSDALSNWWIGSGQAPATLSQDRATAVDNILRTATICDVERSVYAVGSYRHSVAFAVFDPERRSIPAKLLEDERDTAEHEASHAIVALRSKFRVKQIRLSNIGELKGAVRCDWKESRSQYNDDPELLKRAFALAYAGAVNDIRKQNRGLGEVLNSLPTDVKAVEDVRNTAVEWGTVSTINDTRQLSEEGFRLAEQLIEENQDLIAGLTDELLKVRSMDEMPLLLWFRENTIGEVSSF